MKQSEIDRALILIFSSNNAHQWINYILQPGRVDELPTIAKKSLVKTLRRIANTLETRYGLLEADHD